MKLFLMKYVTYSFSVEEVGLLVLSSDISGLFSIKVRLVLDVVKI